MQIALYDPVPFSIYHFTFSLSNTPFSYNTRNYSGTILSLSDALFITPSPIVGLLFDFRDLLINLSSNFITNTANSGVSNMIIEINIPTPLSFLFDFRYYTYTVTPVEEITSATGTLPIMFIQAA
jgi:hypothetical protein